MIPPGRNGHRPVTDRKNGHRKKRTADPAGGKRDPEMPERHSGRLYFLIFFFFYGKQNIRIFRISRIFPMIPF